MILDAYFKIAGYVLMHKKNQKGDQETLNNILT